MGKIVVIGGGEIKNRETLPFDKRIAKLTKKKHPRALFIPTASNDAEGYVETFNKIYGDLLGCHTRTLYLIKERPSKREIRRIILSSDLIYVGGGNTLKMMKRWRLFGVDKVLREAHKKGIVLSGLSAGGICWFDAGHSDSNSFYSSTWKFIKVHGIGLIKGIHCPHFNDEKRRKDFPDFMKKHSGIGIAIENKCAIEFIDGKYKVMTNGGRAYRLFKKNGRIQTEELPASKNYKPILSLYEK